MYIILPHFRGVKTIYKEQFLLVNNTFHIILIVLKMYGLLQ